MSKQTEALPVNVTTSGPGHVQHGAQDVPAVTAFTATADTDIRTAAQAIAWARKQARSDADNWHGLCLMFVRMCFNVAPLYPDAITAWEEVPTAQKHRGQFKRGHAGFMRGGEHGHVVLLLDAEGRCFSTDVREPGQVHVTTVQHLEAAWGYDYLGYTDGLNGEHPVPAPRKRPRVSTREWRLRHLRAAVKRTPPSKPQRRRMLREWIAQVRRGK